MAKLKKATINGSFFAYLPLYLDEVTATPDEEHAGHLDLIKSFYPINHHLLLKVQVFGMGGRLLNWLGEFSRTRSFTSERKRLGQTEGRLLVESPVCGIRTTVVFTVCK